MSKKLIGNVVGIILIVVALFSSLDQLPIPIPQPKPSINLDVNKPTQDILDKVSTVNALINNQEDRIKFAVFNYCFSKRVDQYDTDTQKLGDIYVRAAELYFNGTMKDKYKDLNVHMEKLFVDILGEKNHNLSPDEKLQLKNTFGGLAWSLIQ